MGACPISPTVGGPCRSRRVQSPPGAIGAEFKLAHREYGLNVEELFELHYFSVTLDADGEVLASDTARAAVDDEDAAIYAKRMLEDGSSRGRIDSFAYRVTQKEGSDGERLVIFLDCGRDIAKFNSYLISSLVIGGMGLLLVLLLVVISSRYVLKPVVESYEKQRRFITDAGHEIKTPLAIIDTANEVIKIEHGESEWTKSVHDQVGRLSSLTERLVLLSRMDEGADRLIMGEMDLSETVRTVCEPFYALAEARGKSLEVHCPKHLVYRGDAEAISRALELLLDNATRYAREGGRIEVVAVARGRRVSIEVSNPVDKVPAGDLDRLFERFYRPDTSRSTETGGSGIGLSIVRAVAEAHGGRAGVRARGDVLTFSLLL